MARMLAVALLLLGASCAGLGAPVAHGAAADLVLNATAGQHACWVFDAAATMGDYAAQLSQAHNLTLEQAASKPGVLPDRLVLQLQESSRLLDVLRSWVSGTHSSIGRVFAADALELPDVEAALSPPDLPLEPRHWQGLSSIEPWSGHCHGDVLVQPLMAAFEGLSAQLATLDADLKAQSLLIFGLRAQRAEAAGALEALELHLEASSTARRETLAGLSEVMNHIDGKLWSAPSLRKQVVIILARAMQNSRREAEKALGRGEEGGAASSLLPRLAEARERLRRADTALLQEGRKLKDLFQERKDLAESIRLHLKSTLAQCMPPEKDQPKSRYARFATSSSVSSAVQLTLEVPTFLAQSASGTVPDLVEAMRASVPEALVGHGKTFRRAPAMAQWREWLPEESAGLAAGGFQAFIDRYQDALQAYDQQLAEGGRLAALHSMWLRWGEVDADVPPAASAASTDPPSAAQPRSASGFWSWLSA